jgi:hypothetical protein
MPLRDHFHPPLENYATWEGVHGAWPATIAYRLNAILPPQYRCDVKVHLGTLIEVDAAGFERDDRAAQTGVPATGAGPEWDAESPTLLLETEELTPAEYEVRVYDAFVDKCHAMLQQDVCVVIVDIVTSYTSNLYAELAARLGARPPAIAESSIYAITCPSRKGVRVEAVEKRLAVGSTLPTLPLYLSESLKVPLELEATYEDTCRGLRIA